MITELLRYLNNYFVRTGERIADYQILAGDLIADLDENYAAGQYVWIDGAILNVGAFKITAVGPDRLTLEGLSGSESGSGIKVYGLAIPAAVQAVAAEIDASGLTEGLSSESQGKRAVSYAGEGSSWARQYASRLNPWRRIYPDKPSGVI